MKSTTWKTQAPSSPTLARKPSFAGNPSFPLRFSKVSVGRRVSLRDPFRTLHLRALWYLAAKFLLSFGVLVYASNITMTTTVYHVESGGVINVTVNLTAMDRGLSKTASMLSASGTSCASNVTLTGTPGNCHTVLTSNRLVYSIHGEHNFEHFSQHLFHCNANNHPQWWKPHQLHGLHSQRSISDPDQTINCELDIGSALPTSPYSFSVTVQ